MPFAEAASARIVRFEPGEARMVCVVSLALDARPAHLRRLIERLRERMPGVPVLLGLWFADPVGRDGEPERRDARDPAAAADGRAGRCGADPGADVIVSGPGPGLDGWHAPPVSWAAGP